MITDGVTVAMTEIHCGCCGGFYAIDEYVRETHYKNGTSWNCPYCRMSWGYIESEASRLRKEKAQLQTRLEQKEAGIAARDAQLAGLNNTVRSTRGHLTRLKNRIKHGDCPCCHKRFTDLSDHMKTAHPGYAENKEKT